MDRSLLALAQWGFIFHPYLEIIGNTAYYIAMIDPTQRTKAEWLVDLEASEAEADAGLTVPLAPALERARAALRRLETKARRLQHSETVRHN